MKCVFAICVVLVQLCVASLPYTEGSHLDHYDHAFRLVRRWEGGALEKKSSNSSQQPLQVADPDKLDELSKSEDIGGASYAYNTGSTSPKGVSPVGISLSSVTSHYPGDWGGNAGVDMYRYQVSMMNNTLYKMDCYCIRGQKCTCDRVDRASYFSKLSYLISVKEVFNNYTQFYVNGTMPLPGEAKGANSAIPRQPACALAMVLAGLTILIM